MPPMVVRRRRTAERGTARSRTSRWSLLPKVERKSRNTFRTSRKIWCRSLPVVGVHSGGVAIRDVIETHPQPTSIDHETLVRCITECLRCAATCTSCADASLAEPDLKETVRCIRLCLDCSDLCSTTARVVTRQTAADLGVLRAAVEMCATACQVSGDECERHASHHEHCRLCADACRECKDACDALVAATGTASA
jgi:Domain of Unknown Function (DUF326)